MDSLQFLLICGEYILHASELLITSFPDKCLTELGEYVNYVALNVIGKVTFADSNGQGHSPLC